MNDTYEYVRAARRGDSTSTLTFIHFLHQLQLTLLRRRQEHLGFAQNRVEVPRRHVRGVDAHLGKNVMLMSFAEGEGASASPRGRGKPLQSI